MFTVSIVFIINRGVEVWIEGRGKVLEATLRKASQFYVQDTNG